MIYVSDKMQTGYSYKLSAKEGEDFDSSFKPELTPLQMLQMGVFEGKYLTDCQKEFPSHWFEKAKLSPEKPNPKVKNHPANAGGISVPSKLRLPIRLKVGCQFAFHRLTPVVQSI